MIRILHVVSNMDRAGIETMLMNYYRNIDKSIIQFDFLCNKTKSGHYDEEIKNMGGRIFITPGLNPFKFNIYKKFMDKLFCENKYDIIHVHNGAMGAYALYCAKKNNIKIRIFHAHGASITFDYKWPLKIICKSQINRLVTHRFSCGTEAAICYFGKKFQRDFVYVKNAIDSSKFAFNEEIRNSIRKRYNLEDYFVIGHVGRFMSQKNHKFLIKILKEIVLLQSNVKMVFIGEGELKFKIENLAKELGLLDYIIFLGNIDNVNEWYNAFDVFVLPSIWEGLPVVGIEAQCSGLPCFFSNKITKEVVVSSNTKFLDISNEKKWAEVILNYEEKERKDAHLNVIKFGYDIKKESKRMQDIYLKLEDKWL